METINNIESINTHIITEKHDNNYCTICQVQCNTQKTYKEHFHSKKHMEKTGCVKYRFNCDKCDYHTNGPYSWTKHLETNGHKLSKEDNHKLRSKKGALCTKTGDQTEEYVENIMKTNLDITNIIRIGQTGNKFDIMYQMKDETYSRCLQVKTLGKAHSDEQYGVGSRKPYDDDTLIVCVNVEQTRFCLYYFKDHPKLGMSITFSDTAYQNRPNVYLFTDKSLFIWKLFEMIKHSTSLEKSQLSDYLSDNGKKEYNMIEKLKLKLEPLNLNYQPMMTLNSSTDGFINNYRIQCKYSDNKKGNKYYVSFKKETSKTTYEPYGSTDFDFLICQISGNDKFYVIPMEILIEKGYTRTETCEGIVALYLASPDDYVSDWTLNYIDRFDLIMDKSLIQLGLSEPQTKSKLGRFSIGTYRYYTQKLKEICNQKDINFCKLI